MTVTHTLLTFAQTRPGFDFANYGDVSAYRADSRAATRQLHHVRELARVARYACTNDDVINAASGGRVDIEPYSHDNGAGWRVSYCAGQYYCTEYRAAVARVLATAIWRAWRREIGDRPDCAAQIRRRARQEFSRSVYQQYFN